MKSSPWNDVTAKAVAVDPHTSAKRNVRQATAAERRELYVRGHQLAEIRQAPRPGPGLGAETLGVYPLRILLTASGTRRYRPDHA